MAGVPSGEALVYGDVLDGVDLRYDVRQAQIEETLILTERSEPGEASWRFHLDTKLSTVLADDGSIELRDRSGNVAMTMPIPFVYDSSAVDGVRGPAETNGSMTLRRPTGR